MHIAIIGCGISGLLTALELLEQGCDITLFDQQNAGKAASWAGGGILSPMYPWRYDPAVNILAKHAQPLYQAWNEKLKLVTAIDFEIHQTGMLIFDQDDYETGLSYKNQFNEPLQHCELLTQPKLQQLNPHISHHFESAIHFPYLSNIRNPRLLKSIISYLKQHPKVRFFENTWVEKFEIHQHQIQAITLHHQQRFEADHFVITTGAWSEHWSNQLNLSIPVHPVQGQMLLFKTPQNWLPTMCMNQVMYLIPRKDGHIVCGSSMADLGYEHRPNLKTQQDIYKASIELVPDLAKFPIVKQWAGLRPSSPNGIPYIGKMPNIENLWANFGHFRNGLCMGPASAQLLRALIFKQPNQVNAELYSPTRLIQS